jgi:hypothetical protein
VDAPLRIYAAGVDVDDAGTRLIEALTQLEEVADSVTPDEAVQRLDEASLQVFWRDWPQLSAWAGAVWRKLNHELSEPARPQDDQASETGGSG